MRRFLLALFFSSGALQALPVLNPADPILYTNSFCLPAKDICDDPCWFDYFSWRVGFYGDYVFNRNLQADRRDAAFNNPFFADGGTFKDVTISTNAGMLVLDFCNTIEAFATIGVTRLTTLINAANFAGVLDLAAKLYFSPSMSYTVGAAAPIWQSGCFTIGVQGQWFYTYAKFDNFVAYRAGNIGYFDVYAPYQEYQGAIAASYQFENKANFSFIPFVAMQFSGVRWDLERIENDISGANPNSYRHISEQKIVGWTIGMTALLCDLIGVTAEARFANEKALHVNGQMRF